MVYFVFDFFLPYFMFTPKPRLFNHPIASEITPLSSYLQRRDFIKQSAGLATGLALGVAAAATLKQKLSFSQSTIPGAKVSDKPTAYDDVTTYNNFYEFGTSKSDPATYAHTLVTHPWSVEVDGLVKKSKIFSLEELLKLSSLEERIYRMRCVEGWSMVIPWIGYSLSTLLKKVEPLGSAKYVAFTSLADKKTMRGVNSRILDWPYAEGLRLDEAMHPLTLLCCGLYGEILPPQNGAPVRLVVPWKYGFKSAKSIIKITLTEKQPATSWKSSAPQEYGFYSNVNPNVDHPRWSQATERVIGAGLFAPRRATQMFNGYQEQVAQLYSGMDLQRWY